TWSRWCWCESCIPEMGVILGIPMRGGETLPRLQPLLRRSDNGSHPAVCNFRSTVPQPRGRARPMLYFAYQTHADMMAPVRVLADAGLTALAPWAATDDLKVLRNLTAAYELITRAGLTHTRPPYGIESVRVGNREVAVREEPLAVTPFGTLLHFKKDVEVAQPRVLVVAPLSGHFATLLRSLVRTLLPDHDVCITDWHNARDVGIEAGRFGFDDYVSHLIEWLQFLGGQSHVVAVCQPCVQVLTAVAVMAQSNDPA